MSQHLGEAESLRAVTVSAAMVQQKAADLVRSDARVLVLRARPEWAGGDIKVGNRAVRVVPGISQLGILDICASLAPDDYVVILTDRPRSDLGDSVLARAYRQDIQMPDEWQAVPRLFGAREVSRELRQLDWAATALLDHQPPGGWPATSELALSDTFALTSLLNGVLGLAQTTELDATVLMMTLGQRDVRARWAAVDEGLARHLIGWVSDEFGSSGAFALQVAQRQEFVTPLAVALALDVLWPDDGSVAREEQVAARVRIEPFVDGRTVAIGDAKAAARVAKATVLRAGSEATAGVTVALQQAEALLGDLGWPAGAERSEMLRPGYRARVRKLADALVSGIGVEDALAAIHRHRDRNESAAPDMAVRLFRWLATAEDASEDLGADLQRQLSDGAWVDAALGTIWNGSDDPDVSAAYEQLAARVRARRSERDRVAAARLESVFSVGPDVTLGRSPIGIERLLSDVLKPWRNGGVLLIVLDGLSAAIAVALASEVSRFGLVEHVPSSTRRRLGVVAALPSLTSISRASLFGGKVTSGTGEDERRGLGAAYPGSRTFHKDDLRSDAGAVLPETVLQAITANPIEVPIVGVVINTIDDAVHKTDVSDWAWGLAQLAPLRALLDAAVNARRTVVITSDHGHVVERQTQRLDAPGADARWRPANGAANDGEVLVAGPRVVAPGNEAILLWREDAHYGPRRAGYHGGASLAEITVPVLVFQPATSLQGIPAAWTQAPPQTPDWWNDPIAAAAEPPATRRRSRKQSPEADPDALFSVKEAAAAPSEAVDLVARLLASSTYRAQRSMAGRRAVSDELVGVFLRAIAGRGFRAHRDTLAAALDVPGAGLGQIVASIKRLVNVDGYDVLSLDPDGVTYRVEESLLREQFSLGSARA